VCPAARDVEGARRWSNGRLSVYSHSSAAGPRRIARATAAPPSRRFRGRPGRPPPGRRGRDRTEVDRARPWASTLTLPVRRLDEWGRPYTRPREDHAARNLVGPTDPYPRDVRARTRPRGAVDPRGRRRRNPTPAAAVRAPHVTSRCGAHHASARRPRARAAGAAVDPRAQRARRAADGDRPRRARPAPVRVRGRRAC
jgi:hypothetical protein